MSDYESLRLAWWFLIGTFLIGFTVTEGFDMGVGIIMRIFGRSDLERRIMINTIAPHWDGNQVWLVTAGGALFAAWPIFYAVLFSSFYVIMITTLSALLLRPVGFDYRSKIEHPIWREVWDWAIFFGSFVPPLATGVVLGNLFGGVPYHLDDDLRVYCADDLLQMFNSSGLIFGLMFLSVSLTQGASYLQMRTVGRLRERMSIISQTSAILTALTFTAAVVWVVRYVDGFTLVSYAGGLAESNPLRKKVQISREAWARNYRSQSLLYLIPVLTFLASLMTALFSRLQLDVASFVSSSLIAAGLMSTIGVALFPFIAPSRSSPDVSLTVWDSTSSVETLKIMALATALFLPLVLAYTFWCYRKMFFRVTEDFVRRNSDSLY